MYLQINFMKQCAHWRKEMEEVQHLVGEFVWLFVFNSSFLLPSLFCSTLSPSFTLQHPRVPASLLFIYFIWGDSCPVYWSFACLVFVLFIDLMSYTLLCSWPRLLPPFDDFNPDQISVWVPLVNWKMLAYSLYVVFPEISWVVFAGCLYFVAFVWLDSLWTFSLYLFSVSVRLTTDCFLCIWGLI